MTVDNRGVERMVHQCFIGKIVFAKQVAYPSNVCCRSSEKVPTVRISLPAAGIFLQDVRRIMNGIECDRQEDEVFCEMMAETPLQIAEIIRAAETKIWQRATGVYKIQSNDFSSELGERNRAPVLAGKSEIGNNFSDRNGF